MLTDGIRLPVSLGDDKLSCYKPMKAKYLESSLTMADNKAIKLLGSFNPNYDLEDLKNGRIFTIPCGKCLGCKLDYARHWSDRLILEYKANPKAVFVTLTYNDSHLPVVEVGDKTYSTLVKKHVSRFIKNLRSRKEFKDIKVRFFASGEYGEKLHRCHYHLIIFGIDLELLASVSRLIYRGENELHQIYWQCPLLDDIWSTSVLEKRDGEWKWISESLGYVQVSETSYDTMSYVARYSVKKALGNSWTDDKPIAKEFSLMSRMPGIGAPFLDLHPGIIDEVETLHHNGKSIYWPRYLIHKYYGTPVRIETPFGEHFGTAYKKEFVERQDRKHGLIIDKFIEKYDIVDRQFDEIVDTDLLYKTRAVQSLKRGDM